MTLRFLPAPLTLLPFALMIASCGGASIPPPPAQAQVITTINGTLNGETNSRVALKNGDTTLSDTAVDSNGNFTLTLPSDTTLNTLKTPLSQGILKDLGCTGTLTVSDPAVQGFGVAKLTTQKQSYMNATVSRTLLSRSLTGNGYLYVDRPAHATGTLDCSATTGMKTDVTVDLNVNPGWNVLAIFINGSVGLGGVSVSGHLQNGTQPIDMRSTWTDETTIKAQLGR